MRLKPIQFINTITEILPFSYLFNLCMTDDKYCKHHIKFVSL